MFEWRLLTLERERQDHELRIRAMEGEITKLVEMLSSLPKMEQGIQKLMDDRYKNLLGFVVVILGIVATFIFNHLEGVHP